ncbi:MAG TPA: efflux RND transporter permease subunit, partial [Candidatus Kryptobacter bacterium]|nr:efflux RND transporter permease subunit [Candidatus Kryptobacter bacterium]
MLNRIVSLSLRNRGIIIALAFVALAYGIYSLQNAKYDAFPNFAPPQVQIQTEAPGLSPEQVELLVTQPIENAINGITGVKSLRSGSIQGISVITVVFKQGTDIYLDRQFVAERLATLSGQLPQGVGAPIMTPLTTSTSILQGIGLTSDSLSLMDLRTVADWTIKPRLLAVPGVANVAVFGGEVKQLQVQIVPQLLVKYRLSIEDVVAAAHRATGVRGAGFTENANQRITIQTNGQTLTPLELASTVVRQVDGAVVTIGDVAHVTFGPEPQIGAAIVDGKTGIILMVESQYGANTLEVSRRLEGAIDELEPTLKSEGINVYPQIFSASKFIAVAIHDITSSLLVGGVLVVIILLLFLFNLRTAAISLTAIPLSLLTAVTVLTYFGAGLNTMSIGGLAIAIGEVVDDAVIDVENILRRLRENRALSNPRPAYRVILDASLEVRSAVVYATFAVALVFIPVLTMGGVAGRLFSPLGYAYILSILASLLVALTVTPALCLFLLGKTALPKSDPPFAAWLKNIYGSFLLKVENHSKAVIIGAAALTLGGILVIPFLRSSFLPDFKEGHFIAHVSFVPGTSMEESERVGKNISKALLTIPYVSSVGERIGRAELGNDILGSQDAEFEIDLSGPNSEESDLALRSIRDTLSEIAGATLSINTFLTERINETLSGYTSPVVINIFGNDLDAVDKEARQVAEILGRIKGAESVRIQSPPGMPQLTVNLRKDALLRWGFEPVDVLDAISTVYQGDVVGQIYQGNRVFGVSVILNSKSRRHVEDIGKLLLTNSNGVYVQLSQLANIYESSGRYVILHEGARRVQTITCGVSGRSVQSFMNEVQRNIASKVKLPPGNYVTYSGTAEEAATATRDLILHSLIAAIGILMLLSVVTRNYHNLLLIVVNLPFA